MVLRRDLFVCGRIDVAKVLRFFIAQPCLNWLRDSILASIIV
jgi:hypothetical protein